MNEPRLFDPKQTDAKKCGLRRCGTTRKSLCAFDADVAHGIPVGKRPKTCLNAYDPATAPMPEGY